MIKIPLVVDKRLLEHSVQQYIRWQPDKAPHALLVGGTGSGKTYLAKLLLAKIGVYIDSAELYVADYKGDSDFIFLDGCTHYYRFKSCISGIEEFYARLEARMNGTDASRHFLGMFIDEYASLINGIQDKKQQDKVMLYISDILMMGRSFNVHLIVAQQRADAQFFKTARDNFSLRIGLGNLSKESAEMLFPDHKELIVPDKGRGKGYLYDGELFYEIVVPSVNYQEHLHRFIKSITT